MTDNTFYLRMVISAIAVLTGIFLFITHINKNIGSFLMITGLVYEVSSIIKYSLYRRYRSRSGPNN